MSYYNSELDAFTLKHKQFEYDHDLNYLHHPPTNHNIGPYFPHPHDSHSAVIDPSTDPIPAIGQAVAGSIGSTIANLAVYPLDVVVKRLQVQRALAPGRPETKEERDRREEREKLEREREEGLLAFSLDGDESEREREREAREREKERRRREKERKAMREKRKGVVFDGDEAPSYNGGIRGGAAMGVSLGVGTAGADIKLGVSPPTSYGAVSVEDQVRQDLLREREAKKFARSKSTSVHRSYGEDDEELDTTTDPLPHDDFIHNEESTEVKRRKRHKPFGEQYAEWEGDYEEGDEVEEEANYQYKGVIDAFGKIWEREGIRGFYTGVVEDTVHSLGSGVGYFATYTLLRHQRLKHLPSYTTTLPLFEELSVGILAGAISKFFSTPVANIVTRKQTAVFHARARAVRKAYKLQYRSSKKHKLAGKVKGKIKHTLNEDKTHHKAHFQWEQVIHHKQRRLKKKLEKKERKMRYPGTISIIQDIYKENGMSGFWAGYKPSVLLTLNPAITYLIYEVLRRGSYGIFGYSRGMWGGESDRRVYGSSRMQTFLLGALAKAVACVITYPLAVVKTRCMIKQKKLVERRVKRKKGGGSTDSETSSSSSSSSSSTSSSSSSSSSASDSDSDSDSSSTSKSSTSRKSDKLKEGSTDKLKSKYRKRYRHKYQKLAAASGYLAANLKYRHHHKKYHHNGMFAVAKEIWKKDGLKGFYVGLWAEVLRGFLSNGISMLVKETIFHALTRMYLIFLRARNRTEDKSLSSTLYTLGQDLYEKVVTTDTTDTKYSATVHHHEFDEEDNHFEHTHGHQSKRRSMVERANGLIERGKEKFGSLRSHRHDSHSRILTAPLEPPVPITKRTVTTTTVTEEIPIASNRQNIHNTSHHTTTHHTAQQTTHSRRPSLDLKRKLSLRDSGRERMLHQGTIHDGTHKFGRPPGPFPRGRDIQDPHFMRQPTPAVPPPQLSSAAHARVAKWLEGTQREGLGVVSPSHPAPPPPPTPPPPPPKPHIPLAVPLHSQSFMQRSTSPGPANTPFSSTGTFDVSKSRNIMNGGSIGSGGRIGGGTGRFMYNDASGEEFDKGDWVEDDREWMRRR